MVDVARSFALGFGVIGSGAHKVGVAQHRGHRGFDLMGEGGDKILLALIFCCQFVDFTFHCRSHRVKAAAQCADFIVGRNICALGVLTIGNFLAGCLQRRQRAGHTAAEHHRRAAAQRQQRRRCRQPRPQLGVAGGKHCGHLVGAKHLDLHAGQIQRLGQQHIPPSRGAGQLPSALPVGQGLLQCGTGKGRRQVRVERIRTVAPEGYAAALVGGLLGVLLGSGSQNVIFKVGTVRSSLEYNAFQRVFFFFLLCLQDRAGA